MGYSRRDFLRAAGLVIMTGAGGFLGTDQFIAAASPYDETPKSASAAKQKPTLVTIFLRGGADMLQAIVPVGDPLYYKYRERIALSATTKKGNRGALQMGKSNYWGVNSTMADLLPMIDKGVLVPIVNVGSTNETRSHFSAQDYMERAAPGNTTVTHGWLNRYLEASKEPFDAPLRGLSAQTLVPRALRGSYPVLAGNNRTEQMALFEHLYSPENLVNMTAREGAGPQKGSRLDDAKKSMTPTAKGLTSDMTRDIITESGMNAVIRIKALERASEMENNAEYPQGDLARQLRTIAQVIKADVGLEVAQADYGGWDTHSDSQRMGPMLGHLTECITAFTADLGKRMDKVMVLVMSEFGREAYENGSSGTDHGRGGFMLAAGNMLNGGKIYGTWNGLQDLDHGRFLPVHTDFRAVFAESLVKLFHFDPYKTGIFPGYTGTPKNDLNFLKMLKAEA